MPPPSPSKIVILTGAGISKESGLDTFRGAGGVYERVNVLKVATPEAFQRCPQRVHAFYNARRAGLLAPSVAPNAAHLALALLQREFRGEVTLVTQNVDDLHERAGSPAVVHMHGHLLQARCTFCGAVCEWRGDIAVVTARPRCGEAGGMRVNVVWFGEMPIEMDLIEERVGACDMFVAIGTSGTVYPAAQLVDMAGNGRARTVELNLEPPAKSGEFMERVYGPASQVVPQFVQKLLAEVPEVIGIAT